MIVVSVLLLPLINSLNVLVYSPAFATSHMTYMYSIADTLTDAGHNVTILAPIVEDGLRGHSRSAKTNDLIIVEQDEIMKRELGKSPDTDQSVKSLWTVDDDPSDFEDNFKWMLDQILATCPNLKRNKNVMRELNSRHFDVAFAEPLSICGPMLFKKLGINKTIFALSLAIMEYQQELYGEPNYVSYVPSSESVYTDQMTLRERYNNYKVSKTLQDLTDKVFNEEVRRAPEWGIVNWRDLFPSASAIFVNSNPYLDFPRPVLQKTIQIGGINVDLKKIRAQKLSEEWDEILNLRSKNMLISFGSIARSMDMPLEWRNNILKVIRSLPEVTFIWKYESDDTQWAEGVKNVKFVKWTPQSALLADKRVTAFLTHGGLGSTNELAHLGKPALTVPIFGDQMRNAHMLARHNGSIYFDKFSLSNFNLLNESINSILLDENYRKNAERLADILRDQPYPPKQTVVKHVEFIGKYGPFPNMDPYGRKLSKIQLEMNDVYALIYLSYGLLFVSSFVVLKYLYRFSKNFFDVKIKTN